jgi:hypothetical protein
MRASYRAKPIAAVADETESLGRFRLAAIFLMHWRWATVHLTTEAFHLQAPRITHLH